MRGAGRVPCQEGHGKIGEVLREARQDPGKAAECIWVLLHPDPDSEDDMALGIVGGIMIDDIRRGIESIVKILTQKRK